jgi:hypothetical protein
MLRHFQSNFSGQGPLLSAAEAERDYTGNETPVESVQNCGQLEEVPVNKDGLLIALNDALNEDYLHAQAHHAQTEDPVGGRCSVRSRDEAVDGEDNQQHHLRRYFGGHSVYVHHAYLHEHQNQGQQVEVNSKVQREDTRAERTESVKLVDSPKQVDVQDRLNLFLFDLVFMELDAD